jgi:hypothetical protein
MGGSTQVSISITKQAITSNNSTSFSSSIDQQTNKSSYRQYIQQQQESIYDHLTAQVHSSSEESCHSYESFGKNNSDDEKSEMKKTEEAPKPRRLQPSMGLTAITLKSKRNSPQSEAKQQTYPQTDSQKYESLYETLCEFHSNCNENTRRDSILSNKSKLVPFLDSVDVEKSTKKTTEPLKREPLSILSSTAILPFDDDANESDDQKKSISPILGSNISPKKSILNHVKGVKSASTKCKKMRSLSDMKFTTPVTATKTIKQAEEKF